MGLQVKPQIRDYWSKMDFYNTSWFGKTMAIERFEVIHHTMLYVLDINEKKAKEKIEPFLNVLIKHFQGAFHPFQNISVDEMVIKHKGRWRNKQYDPNKPSKYHIKHLVYAIVQQGMHTISSLTLEVKLPTMKI